MFNCAGGGEHGGGLGGLPVEAGGGRRAGEGGLGHVAAPGERHQYPYASAKSLSHIHVHWRPAACPFVHQKKKQLLQVCEEEAVQIEVFCLAVNCVDRLVFHVYATSSTKLGPIAISFSISVLCPHHILFPQVLGPRPLKTESVATFGQCLPHGRLEGWNHHYKPWHVSFMDRRDNRKQINPHILISTRGDLCPSLCWGSIAIFSSRCEKTGKFESRQFSSIPTTISRRTNSW